jgi:hypothetical protein
VLQRSICGDAQLTGRAPAQQTSPLENDNPAVALKLERGFARITVAGRGRSKCKKEFRRLPSLTKQKTIRTMLTKSITFVVASNSREILENNFLASPFLKGDHGHQVVIQEGFSSASKAYNNALEKSVNDLIVFAHQDILFATNWVSDLENALCALEKTDPNWGVLGCYGETLDDHGRGYILSGEQGILGRPFAQPEQVQTLDEIVLILRKSSFIRFDEGLPHYHFYGTDICMEAAKRNRKAYAISAFCIHNAAQTVVLPGEFYQCYRYMKKKWIDRLPIQTTVIRITTSDYKMYKRRIMEIYLRYIRRRINGLYRVPDGRVLLNEYERAHSVDIALKMEDSRTA